ncbi:hypothetical protein Csp1_11910 [Corynebacterium provencense]|uniref:Secreted protein n=1 Tax=Corynebacterium provencense TaxID=1737425 RepID=A0A2Z3YQQ4_9CORY|nr:hypothetical protein [Corynebacterium provencense]AWT25991.1 hypothetical protein Csp1_11910 [Corynebacterium provencense]MCI1255990.1 hypothetical protein [Corynebacterium provencense]
MKKRRNRAFLRAVAATCAVVPAAATTACSSGGSGTPSPVTTVVIREPAVSSQAPAEAPAPTPAAPGVPRSAPAWQVPAGTAGYGMRYTGYYPASASTSGAFAAAVYSAFTATYATTGNYRPTLTVTSPVTGGTYTMYCSSSTGRSVRCAGGDNAVVVIY